MIEVNVEAVVRLAHLFTGRLAARGRGGLVLFGSIVAGQGYAPAGKLCGE